MTAPHDTPRTDERAGLSEGEVALRDLAEDATPGPWHGDAADGDVWMLGNRERICRTFSQAYHRDAPYIAAASPTAVLGLLDRLAVAEAALTWIASGAAFDGADDPEDAMQERARMALEGGSQPAQRPNGAADVSQGPVIAARRLCEDSLTCLTCGAEFPAITDHECDEGRQG